MAMNVSTLIDELIRLKNEFGDMTVYMDVSCELCLLEVGEVGVDVDDTGIILWSQEKESA